MPGRENGGGGWWRGGRVGEVGGCGIGPVGGGDEGAVEVGEHEAAGGAGVQRDYPAYAVSGGGLPLHAGEEGDGVGELRLRGAVLRGAREATEPRWHRGIRRTGCRRQRLRRRHRGRGEGLRFWVAEMGSGGLRRRVMGVGAEIVKTEGRSGREW